MPRDGLVYSTHAVEVASQWKESGGVIALHIDADGYEVSVLREILGTTSTLPAHVITMAHHSGWRSAGSSLKEAADVMESAGYLLFKVHRAGGPAVPINRGYWDDYHDTSAPERSLNAPGKKKVGRPSI